MNIGLGIVKLQEQHLRDDQVGAAIVNHSLQEDNAVLEQPAVNVENALFAAAAFHHIGYKSHG